MAPKVLLMLAGHPALCRSLARYAEGRGMDFEMLALAKQSDLASELAGKRAVHLIDENMYGLARNSETYKILSSLIDNGFNLALFPANDFVANCFMLGCLLAKRSAAINVSDRQDGVPSARTASMDDLISIFTNNNNHISDIYNVKYDIIADNLYNNKDLIDQVLAARPGEKPTNGLINRFPYDVGVFARYCIAANLAKGLDALDVGAGLGYGASLLADQARSCAGLEPDVKSVEAGRGLFLQVRFEHGRAESIPFPDDSFDVITFFEVIEHVQDPQKALSELKRVARPNALIIGSTPDPRRFPFRHMVGLDLPSDPIESLVWKWHLRAWSPEDLASNAIKAGLADASISRLTFVRGATIAANMAAAMARGDAGAAITALNDMFPVRPADFSLTLADHPAFSDYSYVFTWRID